MPSASFISREPRSSAMRQMRRRDMRDVLDVHTHTIASGHAYNTMMEMIREAQEKGLDWINESNIAEFGQYMDYLRAKYKGAQFDSERALRLFIASEKKDVEPLEVAEDFEYWKKNVSYFEKVAKIKNDKSHSAEDYKKEIEHRKEVRRKLNKAVGKKDV